MALIPLRASTLPAREFLQERLLGSELRSTSDLLNGGAEKE